MTDQELIEKADNLSKAVEVLLKGLATDGTAIEGFVACYDAQFEYTKAVFEREIERLAPLLKDQKTERNTVISNGIAMEEHPGLKD